MALAKEEERERALAGKHNISEIRLARSANRFKPQTADAEFILMNFGDRRRRDPSIKWKKRRERVLHPTRRMHGRNEVLGSGLLLLTKIADALKLVSIKIHF